jgi:hypothetical protein
MKKSIIRTAIATSLLLLIPLTLQLTIGTGIDGQGWNWKPGDFVFAGTLIFVTGMSYAFLASRTSNKTHRIMIGIAALLGFLFVWANAVNDFDVLESVVSNLIG